MNEIELVEKFVQASKAEDEKYGDSRALGATKAMLSEAVSLMNRAISAFDHETAIDIVADMRYVIYECKGFINYLEERGNV